MGLAATHRSAGFVCNLLEIGANARSNVASTSGTRTPIECAMLAQSVSRSSRFRMYSEASSVLAKPLFGVAFSFFFFFFFFFFF